MHGGGTGNDIVLAAVSVSVIEFGNDRVARQVLVVGGDDQGLAAAFADDVGAGGVTGHFGHFLIKLD
jgi:uncharacterized membrane protein